MKFIVVLAFCGFALAAAGPLGCSHKELETKRAAEDLFLEATLETEKEITLEEVQKQLKERFEVVLNKIKDAIEQGKGMGEEALHKLKELRDKLRIFGFDVEKEILDHLKEKGKDYLKKIFERFGLNKRDIEKHTENVLLEAEGDLDIGKLKEKFNDLVNKIKDAFEQGKSIKDALDKLQDLKEKLKLLNIDLGENGKEYLEKLKEKVKDYWNKLKEKLGMRKRSADIDVFGMLEELKQMIREKFDISKLKDFINKVLGRGSELKEQLLRLLEKYGGDKRQVILDWIDRILGQQSVADIYEKVKNYFKELNIELKEKFIRFGEWVKNQYDKGLEKGKTKMESIKKIAKEFLKDTQQMSKDMAQEALDFFREYKEDLGNVYDELVEKVKEIRKN